MSELEYKEVSQEIMQKVINFVTTHKTFTTKELFLAYPNNQEFLLRYALNNLRIEKKVYMQGNKKGAIYLTAPDLILNTDYAPLTVSNNSANYNLQERVLALAQSLGGWFTRPELKIEDVSPPIVISALQSLINNKKLQSRGVRRWTQYALPHVSADIINDHTKDVIIEEDSQQYNLVLEYIKKHKVVTVPILIEALDLQRNEIVAILQQLCEKEEIWHEGIKKSSKYMYKDIDSSKMNEYLTQLNRDRKLDQRIDALSQFLINDNTCSVIFGADKNGDFSIKFIKNADIVKEERCNNVTDCLSMVKLMTEIVDE